MTTIVDDLDFSERTLLTVRPARPRISGGSIRGAAVFAIAIATFSVNPAFAFSQLSDLVIDPTQSYVTLSGTTNVAAFTDLPFTEQFPGSLTTQLSGHIFADIGDFSSIFFSPLSTIDLALQSTPATESGIFPQLAIEVSNFPVKGKVSYGALHDITLSISAGTTSALGGILDVSPINFTMPSGKIDVHSLLADQTTNVLVNGQSSVIPGSLEITGDSATILIPFTFAAETEGANFQFSGQIVAVASIPEPTTLILAATCSLTLMLFGGRRIR